MVFDVVTIFPDFFKGPFDFGVVRRGREKGLIETRVHDLRDFTSDHHHTVDDRPFGGGEGMVFKPEPIFKAIETVRKDDRSEVVVLAAAGRRFSQAEALRFSKADQVILICGRYEGIDERVIEHLHYTRPAEFRGWKVPEVLISGDHEAVRKWRYEAALKKTTTNRPDLLNFEFRDEKDDQTR